MLFYKFLRKWYDNHYKLQQGGGEMEYTLENERYQEWRTIHTNTFGDVFTLAFEDVQEAQLQLTAALIKISKRDYDGGLQMLKKLEDFCFCAFDCFALSYFIGLCYEFIGNEEQMNHYYEAMSEQNIDYLFTMVFHPFYRSAKFAQRKSENEKALHYYKKAIDLYLGQETSADKRRTIGLLYYEMGTVYLSCQNYKKSRQFLEKSYEYCPEENAHRTYVTAILCAAEGNRAEAEKLIHTLPEYLKTECQRILSSM